MAQINPSKIPFQDIVTKLDKHEKYIKLIPEMAVKLDKAIAQIEKNNQLIISNYQRTAKLEIKVDEIDKRTKFLPKLYDAIDLFMGEIRENRQERVFLERRVERLEESVGLDNQPV